jgi:hypothetical protein
MCIAKFSFFIIAFLRRIAVFLQCYVQIKQRKPVSAKEKT